MPVSKNSDFWAIHTWGHRGSGGRLFPDNSPEGVQQAIQEGFPGVELDVFYSVDEDEIIVSHDPPHEEGLAKGLPLSGFDIPSSIYVWLDFKNLDELKPSQITAFAERLKELGYSRNVFVESRDMTGLLSLKEHGFKTVLWLSGWTIRLVPLLKYYLSYSGITAVSIDYMNLSRVSDHFSDDSVFTFTVNDRIWARKICASPEVAVFLTDMSFAEAGCEMRPLSLEPRPGRNRARAHLASAGERLHQIFDRVQGMRGAEFINVGQHGADALGLRLETVEAQ